MKCKSGSGGLRFCSLFTKGVETGCISRNSKKINDNSQMNDKRKTVIIETRPMSCLSAFQTIITNVFCLNIATVSVNFRIQQNFKFYLKDDSPKKSMKVYLNLMHILCFKMAT